MGQKPLIEYGHVRGRKLLVEEFINSNGTWNQNKLAYFVPRDKVDDILNIPLPISTSLEDAVVWGGSGAGKFSVENCYNLIIKEKVGAMDSQRSWKWLWKLKIPYRILHFLWLLRQRKILTNKACLRRGIRQDDLCKSCLQQEDDNHIFTECRVAKRIWHTINPQYLLNFGDENFEMWLDVNLKHQESGNSNLQEWNTLFAVTFGKGGMTSNLTKILLTMIKSLSKAK